MTAHVTKQDCAALLAPALGQDKSDEVIVSTARLLGIAGGVFTAEDVGAIFDVLVKAEGLVGVIARFAVARGDVDKLVARSPRPEAGAQTEDAVASSRGAMPVDLLALLAPALGAEKAREAIGYAAARRGIEGDATTSLPEGLALAVLDDMATVEGIVGVIARFAKARLLRDSDG